MVGDSKYVIVFDPLLTGHVIRRMRSGRVRIFNGNVVTRNSRTDRRRVFILGGKVGHVTRQYNNCSRSKGQRSKSRGHAQEIYAVKGFSIGDALE